MDFVDTKGSVNITMQVEPVSCWYNVYRWWVAQRKKNNSVADCLRFLLFQDTQNTFMVGVGTQ